MVSFQMSDNLLHLKEKAVSIGNKSNPPFTAERFLVALIDWMMADESNGPMELRAAATGLEVIVGPKNIPRARQILLEYIDQKDASFLDDLYMKKKLQEAAKCVAERNPEAPVINVTELFERIVADPSETIKKIMCLKEQSLADVLRFSQQTEERIKPEDTEGTVDAEEADESEKSEESEKVAEAKSEKKQDPMDSELTEDEIDQLFAELERRLQEDAEKQEKQKANQKAGIGELTREVKKIREELQRVIFGQDKAINTFASGYFQAGMAELMGKQKKRPRATFLFAGPPGVGKTFLAETVAETLGLPYRRFDMSEYSDKEATLQFSGSDKVYRNGKPGNVTSFVEKHPKCVLLFDEIEKAHLNVIHLFLQMLDAGRLRDSYNDNEVSFSDALIIMTTNAGKQLYEECEDLSAVSRKVVLAALEKDVNPVTKEAFFPAAICSRFATGNVVMFNHMEAHNLKAIVEQEMKRNAEDIKEQLQIECKIDDSVYTALLLAEGGAADARTVRSRAETFFNSELYELFRFVGSEKVNTDINCIEKIHIFIDLQSAADEVKNLFCMESRAKALVVADKETVAKCMTYCDEAELIGAQNADDAVEVLKNNSIDFVLLDMEYGAEDKVGKPLNVADVQTPAREFCCFMQSQNKALPLYMLEKEESCLSTEETNSFLSQGIRKVVRLRDMDAFAAEMKNVVSCLHQHASMEKLARENKLITFETAQTLSEDGTAAEIRLFDLKLDVAVDADDAKNILSAVSKPDVRFEDVIGAKDAKEELKYFVEYLKNPKKYMGTGVKAPKGIIFYGPPGTGKTLLAKAMACEAGVTFIAAEGNQFLMRSLGEGPEKVHQLFRTARKYAPSILFIDEIDAIAKERGTEMSGDTGTLTAFLTEMDGFSTDPSRPVFVLAATNFDVEPGSRKSLDPALMRRFDRRICIDLPDKEDRMQFLQMKIKKNQALQISAQQVENIATRANGMSLAELDSVVELALRSAIRAGQTIVGDALFEESLETFNNGEVKQWDASQLERVARHEAGHALVSMLGGEKPTYLTIVARGSHGGYMQHAPQEGKAIYTRDELLARIRTSLAGRAAEIVYYGTQDGISTGASGDFASATSMAHQMICTYGMDDEFGLAVIPDMIAADGTMSVEVRKRINCILKEQMQETVRLISENKDRIDSLVQELLAKNHLNAAEIEAALA